LPKETLGLAVDQPLSTALGFLGAVAFFAGLVAIIWASESALVVEIAVIVFLWAATHIVWIAGVILRSLRRRAAAV